MYKVLIVDDEVLVRVGLKTTINWEANGFTVIAEASNGEQGYEQYKRNLPDVIITDIKMPRKDGLWLIEQVRKENREVRILVLTCYDEFTYARKALKYGVDDYILKSEVEDEELVAVMQSIKKKIDALYNTKHVKEKVLTNRNDIKRSIFTDMIKLDFNLDAKLLESCSSIEFPIVNTKFVFACISINDNINGKLSESNSMKQTNHAVLNIIFDLFAERSIDYIYTHQTKKYMFCLSSQALMGTEMKRLFISVSNSIKQYFDISLNIVFTETFNDISSASIIYKKFIEKAQILFYKNETPLFITNTEGISFNEANVINLKKQYNKRFIEMIGQEDIKKAEELIHEVGNYFEQNLVNPRIVKMLCSNLVEDVFNSYGLFIENSQRVNNYEHYHSLIENSEHIQNIVLMLMDFTVKVIDEIKNMRNNNSKAMINKALNYIQYHYEEKISLDDVAHNLNLSKHYLCSAFKKETGENMSLYINKLRIEKAKSRLLESDGRIKEIFEEVGYSNQQYFSKVFKKITGITVMEYKENRMHKE